MDYEMKNYELWKELNDMTYKPTTSIAFCVTRPKLREVFAADFRDRIVHHLFIGKLNGEVERRLSDSCCACRNGKGSLYAARRLKAMMERNAGGWYGRCDVNGFFMSIDKDILHELVNDVVCKSVSEDLGWWLWLADTLIFHCPEKCCEMRGDISLWDRLPDNKTLFRTHGVGLPIGNLTSQVLANLYLAEFDARMIGLLGDVDRYIRYMDDFIVMHPDKMVVCNAIRFAREWMGEHRNLTIHKRKVVVQRNERGVRFVGYFVKGGVIHCGKAVRANTIRLCKRYSEHGKHTDGERKRLMTEYNSYSGLLKHTASYMVRRKMWRSLGDYDKITNINMLKIRVGV